VGNSYTWGVVGSGAWSTASNWFDVTTGTVAVAAPGTADVATIEGPGTGAITVTGPASVLGLEVDGGVALAGNFSIGSFNLANPITPGPGTITSDIALAGTFVAQSVTVGSLFEASGDLGEILNAGIVGISTGDMLSAGTVTLTAGDLQVGGGAVSVSGLLSLGEFIPAIFIPDLNTPLIANGSLDVSNHASVQLGSLAIQGGSLGLDATSTLEIGSAGTATAGTITVDPGAELTVGYSNPFLVNSGSDISVAISAPVLNNGSILDYGFCNLSDVVNNGTITAQFARLSAIGGAGQIDLGGAGDLTIGPNVSGTVEFSPSATLDIALGTGVTIDTADTPLIAGFGAGDAMVLQGISADSAHYTPTGAAIGTLTLDSGSLPVASLTLLGTYGDDEFVPVTGSNGTTVTFSPTCYCRGTRILTPQGEVAIEDLGAGDTVLTASGLTVSGLTASGDTRPIVWIGRRSLDCRGHPRPERVWPVRIAADAFGRGLPRRALWLSPDHAVFVCGVLIPVKHLVNGTTVAQIAVPTVSYFHIELDRHDILRANGLPAESYLDTGDRAHFENGGPPLTLHPDFATRAWEAQGCARLVIVGPEVDAAREVLRAQAASLAARPGPRRTGRGAVSGARR
jgi:hypothetical protein